jgi:hypothetical protein
MENENNKLFTFSELLKASFVEISGKFIRLDNNENIGIVYAKYDDKYSLDSIANNGKIIFINDKKIIKIYGHELDVNEKIFMKIS